MNEIICKICHRQILYRIEDAKNAINFHGFIMCLRCAYNYWAIRQEYILAEFDEIYPDYVEGDIVKISNG